ncbi:hypothetical protein [Candidatus Lokiarchaeum ossiferum]
MSEMLTDLLQNIYSRIATLGKSIQTLQGSVESLNTNLGEKVQSLVDSIKSMTESVEKEGETQNLVFKQIGEEAVQEIQLLQERVGLKDLDELTGRLNQFVDLSQEALKPETVDILLREVLDSIREVKEGPSSKETTGSSEDLLQRVDDSLSGKSNPSPQPTPSASVPPPTSPSPPTPPPAAPDKKKNLKDLGPPPGTIPPPN